MDSSITVNTRQSDLSVASQAGHFRYPLSAFLYIATGILLGISGPPLLLGLFLWKQRKRSWGALTIISGFILFCCWGIYLLQSELPEIRLAYLHFGVSILWGIICFLVQRILVKRLFSDSETAGFMELRKLDRGDLKDLLIRLITWNIILYSIGIFYFLPLGESLFPPGTAKTAYLILTLKWALTYLIAGTIVALITNFSGREQNLILAIGYFFQGAF